MSFRTRQQLRLLVAVQREAPAVGNVEPGRGAVPGTTGLATAAAWNRIAAHLSAGNFRLWRGGITGCVALVAGRLRNGGNNEKSQRECECFHVKPRLTMLTFNWSSRA